MTPLTPSEAGKKGTPRSLGRMKAVRGGSSPASVSTHRVSSYVRKAPFAEQKAKKTRLLREFVIFRGLEQDIAAIVDEAARRERGFELTGGLI